ncbi:MAG: CoA-binding protein [candidate division Zixibacteria bacterium]|nr:CoA-binding protein [candidate division Zixibacteria bacterium]
MFNNPDDNELKQLLKNAKRIAVIGASPKSERASHGIARYLLQQGYEMIPVNPMYDEILGEKTYPDLKSIPGEIDIVDVFRKPEAVMPVAEEAIEAGAKALWLQQGVINQQAAEKAIGAGLTTVMDLCIYMEHLRLIRSEQV